MRLIGVSGAEILVVDFRRFRMSRATYFLHFQFLDFGYKKAIVQQWRRTFHSPDALQSVGPLDHGPAGFLTKLLAETKDLLEKIRLLSVLSPILATDKYRSQIGAKSPFRTFDGSTFKPKAEDFL